MKKVILQITVLSLFLFFTNCAKEDKEPDPPAAVDKGSFNWQVGSGANVVADSAHFYQQFTTIFAFNNGNNNSIEMNLSSLSAGTYTFSSSSGNVFTHVAGNSTYLASSGTCNISTSAGNKLSGSFNVTFNGASPSTMTGNFTNILGR